MASPRSSRFCWRPLWGLRHGLSPAETPCAASCTGNRQGDATTPHCTQCGVHHDPGGWLDDSLWAAGETAAMSLVVWGEGGGWEAAWLGRSPELLPGCRRSHRVGDGNAPTHGCATVPGGSVESFKQQDATMPPIDGKHTGTNLACE